MKPTTLIIVGAGMSARLGLPTTQKINDIIKILLDYEHEEKPRLINLRLKEIENNWPKLLDQVAQDDLTTTLQILFDGDGARNNGLAYKSQQKGIKEYVKKFCVADTKTATLQLHLSILTQTYDLIALKSIIYSLKHVAKYKIDIVDILTAIQSSIADGISIPTHEIFPDEKEQTKTIWYCDRKRLEGALNAYKLLVYKIFKHLLRHIDVSDIGSYEEFYSRIAADHAGLKKLDSVRNASKKENYLSDIGYLTYNWDPILPFLSMKVNQALNEKLLQESGNEIWKKVYVDFGVPFAGIALSGDNVRIPVYSLSEDAAFLINDFTKTSYLRKDKQDAKSKILIKIMKLFVPHGLFNIRICPRCQNGFFIFPENISKIKLSNIANLFTSDPIPSEYDQIFIKDGKFDPILEKYQKGLPDEIDCPSCEHPVYFEHSFMEIQSIIKNDKPPAINKIQFDYADFFSRAEHVVAIGYSFPRDDILNSVFLKNMKIRKDELGKDCKLTFVGSPDPRYAKQRWYNYQELGDLNGEANAKLRQIIEVMEGIFKKENMRFNFFGFPDILKKVDIKNILAWRS